MMQRIRLSTAQRQEMVDITDQVRRIVKAGGVNDGLCVVFCPHTTAGLTINENADPAVRRDIARALSGLVPANDPGYTHSEGNSDSHIRASLLGSSVTVIVNDGQLALGTWQGIFFCEADGPRQREVLVQVAASA